LKENSVKTDEAPVVVEADREAIETGSPQADRMRIGKGE